tara:strand:+ start:3630 stop:4880 length:1251 start_codon:yes stop_codon:yes gene_type:complete
MLKQIIKTNMAWIKIIITNICVFFLLILFIDLVGYTFFSKSLKKTLPLYDRSSEFGHQQTHDYYQNHATRGFDIIPNRSKITDILPIELGEYDIWSNNYSCFDKNWDAHISNKEDIIYLAGDSFTWGYVAFEHKFSTILDQNLKSNVINCGVSHTGQQHQFSKFLEIYNQWKPKVVIVNFFNNDVADDFFFPSASVSNGFLIENYEYCIKDKSLDINKINKDDIIIRTKNLSELDKVFFEKEKKYLEYYSAFIPRVKKFLKKYSLTANLFNNFFILNLNKEMQFQLVERLAYCPQFSNNGDLLGEILLNQEYQKSNLSMDNRDAIKDWIMHANINDYRIIFSYIPSKYEEEKLHKYTDGKKNFILSQGAEVIDFANYLKQFEIDKSIAYHKNDGHFSIAGNSYYAKYLISYLKESY